MRKASEVRKDIGATCATAGALQTKVHELGLECLQHAEAHGDVTLIDLLVKDLPKGQRVEALKAWVEAFSPVRWGGDGKVGMIDKRSTQYTPFNLEDAAKKPYYSFTKEKNPRKLSLQAMVALVAGLNDKIDAALDKGQIDDDENVEAMRDYANRLKAIKPVSTVKTPETDEDTSSSEETTTETTIETTGEDTDEGAESVGPAVAASN